MTLGNMRTNHVRSIVPWCVPCQRSGEPVSLDRWPDETVLLDLDQQFVCSVCGSRNVTSMPNWSEMYTAWLTQHQGRPETTKGPPPVGAAGQDVAPEVGGGA